jgi:hypothetical protein
VLIVECRVYAETQFEPTELNDEVRGLNTLIAVVFEIAIVLKSNLSWKCLCCGKTNFV